MKIFLSLVLIIMVTQGGLVDYKKNRNLQTTTCNAGQIVVDGVCKENDLDVSALTSDVTVFSDVGFNLKFGFPDDLNIQFYMEIAQKSYLSIGIGELMSHADIFTAIIDDDDNVILKDTISNSYAPPSEDSQQDLTLLGYEVTDNSVKVKFQRKLDTGDSNDDIKLVKGEKIWLMAAFASTKGVSQHKGIAERKAFQVTLEENQSLKTKEEKESTMHKLHTLGLLFAWGIFVDIGIVIPRHLKTWRYYQDIHAFIFFVINVFTLVVGFGKRDEVKAHSENNSIRAHGIIGFLFLFWIIIHHLGGSTLKIMTEKYKGQKGKLMNLIQKAHKLDGYAIYIVAKTLVILGAYANYKNKGEDDYSSGFVFCAIGILIQIISVLVWQMQKKKQARILSYTQVEQDEAQKVKVKGGNEQNELIVQQTQDGQQLTGLKKEDKVCVLFNKIILLNNFLHPGGNYILDKIQGREVDRFIYGGYALEGDDRAQYLHSKQAELYLLKNIIGEIQQDQIVLTQMSNSQKLWTLENIDMISSTTGIVRFKSNLKVKNYLKGVEWMGRNFQVNIMDQEKRRLYTTVQSYTQDNINYRKDLYKYAKGGFTDGDKVNKMPETSDLLPLIIKEYKFKGTLSSLIYSKKYNNFEVNGPYGLGLHMNKQSKNNTVIITGGTGILPYLDLINYLFQKAVYMIGIKEKGINFAKENLDINEIDLENNMNGNNFKVTMYSSFYDESEFLGRDIIEPLVDLCNQHQLNIFSFKAKFSKKTSIQGIETVPKHFNTDFFRSEVNQWGEIDKVWVCGPPGMNAAVPPSLEEVYVPKEKICFI